MSRSYVWKLWRRNAVFGILPTGFGEESYFVVSTERLVETRTAGACVLVVTPLVSIIKDQVEDLTCLGLRAFAIGLGDEKGEKTFDRVSIFIAGRLELHVVVGVVH